MYRNHNIVYVAHCFFNQNSVVPGEARLQEDLLALLFEKYPKNTSFIQMRCPEKEVAGLNRPPVGYNDLHNVKYLAFCQSYIDSLITEILEYQKCGATIKAIIGIKGSPSCGVGRTCESYLDETDNLAFRMIEKSGTFIECLKTNLNIANLDIELFELD